ncbi:unnamed protein product, partial [Polarella glacialis]
VCGSCQAASARCGCCGGASAAACASAEAVHPVQLHWCRIGQRCPRGAACGKECCRGAWQVRWILGSERASSHVTQRVYVCRKAAAPRRGCRRWPEIQRVLENWPSCWGIYCRR